MTYSNAPEVLRDPEIINYWRAAFQHPSTGWHVVVEWELYSGGGVTVTLNDDPAFGPLDDETLEFGRLTEARSFPTAADCFDYLIWEVGCDRLDLI